jgi:hypothetical protein
MVKGKRRKGFPLTIVLSDLFVDHCMSFCPFSSDHCIICPSVCRSLFVPFPLTIVLSDNGQRKKDKRTNNDLQTEGQIIQWSEEKGQKDKQ